MYTTKTINYKDGQHVYHQNNSIQDRQHVSATCTPPKQLTAKMGNMHTTKTINYKDGQHVHHQNN